MFTLFHLPPEIWVEYIAPHASLVDLFAFQRTCRIFAALVEQGRKEAKLNPPRVHWYFIRDQQKRGGRSGLLTEHEWPYDWLRSLFENGYMGRNQVTWLQEEGIYPPSLEAWKKTMPVGRGPRPDIVPWLITGLNTWPVPVAQEQHAWLLQVLCFDSLLTWRPRRRFWSLLCHVIRQYPAQWVHSLALELAPEVRFLLQHWKQKEAKSGKNIDALGIISNAACKWTRRCHRLWMRLLGTMDLDFIISLARAYGLEDSVPEFKEIQTFLQPSSRYIERKEPKNDYLTRFHQELVVLLNPFQHDPVKEEELRASFLTRERPLFKKGQGQPDDDDDNPDAHRPIRRLLLPHVGWIIDGVIRQDDDDDDDIDDSPQPPTRIYREGPHHDENDDKPGE